MIGAAGVESSAAVADAPGLDLDSYEVTIRRNDGCQVERQALPKRDQDWNVRCNERGEDRSFGRVAAMNALMRSR
jgi:hypothetical protein